MSDFIRGGIASQVESLRQKLAGQNQQLQEFLGAERVQRIFDEEDVHWREKQFTPWITLWAFLGQVFSSDQSCQSAISLLLGHWIANGKRFSKERPPPGTDAYCKARKRIPEKAYERLVQETGDELHAAVRSDKWLGCRPIKVVDGATVSMPDTKDNQREYPQACTQAEGLGFPIARLVVLMSLASGAVLDMECGPYQGKGTGESGLFRQMMDRLSEGDIALADRYFASYWMIALLLSRGVDSVFRQHQLRRVDFRKGKSLGPLDHIVTLTKPTQRPEWMDIETYNMLVDEIRVREVRVRIEIPGYRTREITVVTTLLDAELYTKADIASAYWARWHGELDLRNIKSTMQMDVLRCRTPDMVRREIWTHLLGYNIIRTVMADAARKEGCEPREISFKATLQQLNALRPTIATATPEQLTMLYDQMLTVIAVNRVGDRPHRYEPRAIKRRNSKYSLLRVPRHKAHAKLAKGVKA